MTSQAPESARDAVASYRFQNGSNVDPGHLPLVRELALFGRPATAAAALRHCRALASLVEYHVERGLPVERTTLLDQDTVTRHLARVAATRHAHAVKTHAVALRRVALADGPAPAGTGPRLPVEPYGPEDVQRLLDWADSAPEPHVRHGLLGLLAFGVGAGLDATDLAHLNGTDVTPDGPEGAVLVHAVVRPGPGRTVPILGPWERLGAELAAAAGSHWALNPAEAPDGPRNWKRIVAAGRPDPRLPDLNPRRCRRTWLHTHLEGGTPLQPLMRAAGIGRTTSLIAPTRRLDPLTPGDRDHELRTGGH